jgi:DTW domain-containing protein YfiP
VKEAHCICGALARVENPTEVVFVRHHWEAFKSTNTARIALLVLGKARLIEYGFDPRPANAALAELENACLLYPGSGETKEGPPPRYDSVVILDGTWAQTRRMLRRLPALAKLPRLSLPPRASGADRLRHGHLAEGLSTIEAAAGALELLDGPEVGAPLERASRLYVASVFAVRGKSPR